MDPARELFGEILRKWFASNQWPQSITETWAKSCGSPGPWASQISPAINNKLDPKVAFFVALGNFNQAVAERNVMSVQNQRVRGLLAKGQPLMHDDGVPYGAEDFFKLFTGLIQPPSEYMQAESEEDMLSDERMQAVSEACRQAFAEVGKFKMMAPPALWQNIKPYMAEYLDTAQLEHMMGVLSGWETLSPDICAHVKEQGQTTCLLVHALQAFAPVAAAESKGVQLLNSITGEYLRSTGDGCGPVLAKRQPQPG